ncbi:MAG: O-antigen ligase family protein [Acidimicrobiia bacterium]|nr:O-antigen ligase family protein [Acidimicrobiia bacterium]
MSPIVVLTLLTASLPAIVAVAVWMWRRPIRFLAAYFAVLPVGSAVSLPLGLPSSFSTVSSLLGLLVIAVYFRRWKRERPPLRIPSLSVPVWAIYLALAAASTAWSIRSSATINGLLVLISLIGLFFVVVVTPITSQELGYLRAWIATGAALTGLYGIVLAATGNLQKTGAGLARFMVTGAGGGDRGDPNITAAAFLVPISIALWEGLNPDRSRKSRGWYLTAAALAGSAVLLTASRGGLLSLGVVSVVTILSRKRGILSLVLLGLMVLPTMLLIPSTFQERADNTGTSGRTEIWRLAIDSCPQYCPTGSGYGTFADVHEAAILVSEDATGTKLRYQAHSIWLEALIELGVLGFALLIVAFAITMNDLIHVNIAERGGALAGLIGLLVANTFLSTLTFKYFWLGLIYALLVVGSAADKTSISPLHPAGHSAR